MCPNKSSVVHNAGCFGETGMAPMVDAALVVWCNSCKAVDMGLKDSNTILSLCMWELWKHGNTVVFDGASTSTAAMIKRIESEGRSWK